MMNTTTPTNIQKQFKDRHKRPEMPAKEAFQKAIISIYSSVGVKNGTTPKKYANAWEFFQRCSDPENEALRKLTQELRELKQKDPEAYKAQRRKRCPAFAVGKWASRGNLAEPSRLLGFDIDGGGEDTHVFNLENASKSPFIARMEQSLGGGGRIWAFSEFAQGRRAEAYQALCEHFSEVFALPIKNGEEEGGEHIDPATGDITRLWFPAYTPPNLVYQPETFQIFSLPEDPQPEEKKGHRGGDQPPRGNGKYFHEFTTEEKVNDICRQISERGIDITHGVETWFAKVLLPLAHEYGEGGRHLAHLVSQFHPSYPKDGPGVTDREFSRALAKERGAVTIGTFLEHARQQGITFDAQSIIASRRAAQDGKPASQPAPAAQGEAGIKIFPPLEMTGKELPEPSYGSSLQIKDGRYYCPAGKKGNVAVTNFTITPLYLLRDNREPKRVMEITNVKGEKVVICCPVKALTSLKEFSAIVEGKGNFVPSFSTTQFSIIKEYLYEYEEAAEEISVLGHQPATNHYAFANGVFDGKGFYQANEYGIVKIEDQRFYLPAFSLVNEDAAQEYHNERKFVFENGKTTFKEWAAQLVKVFGDNAKIGVCFVVAAAFRDIVFSNANNFPLLFLFGPPKTGKSTFRLAMMRLFGNYTPTDAIGLESASSPKGFARKLAQVKNGLVAFEEYKNKIRPELIGMLKNVYDGIGYERAQTTNDNRTHATLVNSAVILGGQEMPTKENALFSRVTMLTFGKTKFNDQERAAFVELEKTIADGLGNVLLEILQHRETVATEFSRQYAQVYSHLRQDPTTAQMDERAISNVAALLAPFRALANLLSFPFDYKDAYGIFRNLVKSQHEQMAQTNEVNQFWQIFDALEGKSIFKGNHYDVRGESLYIDMKGVFPVYYEQAQRQNVNALDQTTLESYLAMQTYFERPQGGDGNGRLKTRITMESNGRKKVTRCLQFRHEDLDLDFLQSIFDNSGQ